MMKLRALRTFFHEDLVRRGHTFETTKANGQNMVARGLAAEIEAEANPAPAPKAAPAEKKPAADAPTTDKPTTDKPTTGKA